MAVSHKPSAFSDFVCCKDKGFAAFMIDFMLVFREV